MECPRCHIQTNADFCPGCGLDLGLRQDLQRLREEFETLKKSFPPAVSVLSGGPSRTGGKAEPPPATAAAEDRQRAQSSEKRQPPSIKDSGATELAVGQKWFLGLGVLILLLGAGFFLKYAFDTQLLGPTTQVTAGFVAGAFCLASGEVLRRRNLRGLDVGIAALGFGLIYLSAYAASQIYDLLPAWLALTLMLAGTALGITLALNWNSQALGALSLAGGFLATILFHISPVEQVLFFSYLIVLNIGGQLLTFMKRWPWIDFFRFSLTWIAYGTWMFSHRQEDHWLLCFSFNQFLFLSLSIVPFLQTELDSRPWCFVVGVVNGLFCAENSGHLLHFERLPTSLVTLVYALLCFSLAVGAWRQARPGLRASWLIGKGAVFLLITAATILHSEWITAFWAAQMVVLFLVAVRTQDRFLRGCTAVLALIVALRFVLSDTLGVADWPIGFAGHHPFTTDLVLRWLTAAVVIGSLIFIAVSERSSGQSGRYAGWFELLGVITLFGFLNGEAARSNVEFFSRAWLTAYSVLWSFFGAGLLGYGLRRKRRVYRVTGIGLLLLTVAKVLAFDTAEVSTPCRVLSCLALGAVLVGLSFLYHRFSESV